MAIWLIRAGSHGEYEQKFISENRVYHASPA
jgi:restriction system protein